MVSGYVFFLGCIDDFEFRGSQGAYAKSCR